MKRTCEACGHSYNDEYSYTLCPHVPLGAGPAPFDPIRNPGGYCKEHDLFACKMPQHQTDKREETRSMAVMKDSIVPRTIQELMDFVLDHQARGYRFETEYVSGGARGFAAIKPAGLAAESPTPESLSVLELEPDRRPQHPDAFRPLRGIQGTITDDMRPKTAGIPPATQGPLAVLQFQNGWTADSDLSAKIRAAAKEIASYHSPTEDQATRHRILSLALEDFLVYIVQACPPGPERSTAISWARASKMFAAAAISLE